MKNNTLSSNQRHFQWKFWKENYENFLLRKQIYYFSFLLLCVYRHVLLLLFVSLLGTELTFKLIISCIIDIPHLISSPLLVPPALIPTPGTPLVLSVVLFANKTSAEVPQEHCDWQMAWLSRPTNTLVRYSPSFEPHPPHTYRDYLCFSLGRKHEGSMMGMRQCEIDHSLILIW